jgi:hypothetical protein
MMTTDWNSILVNRENVNAVHSFANGRISGEDFYARFSCTKLGGHVRNLLRTYGVERARILAKKALNRRELV